jgi:hypothetical protein
LIASDCLRIAKAIVRATLHGQTEHSLAQGGSPLQEALSLSRRAVEIYTRLRHPQLQSAQETLEGIERAIHE